MWKELLFLNERLEQGVRRSLMRGVLRINPDTGLIDTSPAAHAAFFDGNWLFFGHNTALRDCFTWHSVMFDCFDSFVPEFCRLRCYKVVVKTRNFFEAMRFRDTMLAAPRLCGCLTPLMGKTGVDEREYTDGHFNGFIYCDGLNDAREKWKIVRQLLDAHVEDGANIPVIIKRTCTEFERKHGPTDGAFWQSMSDEDLQFQRLLEDIYKGMKASSVQPDWMQNKVIARMVKWANTFSDKSWTRYFGCDDFLTMHAVTYHDDLLKDKEVKRTKLWYPS